MNERLASTNYDVDQGIKADWWSVLKQKCSKNKTSIKVRISFTKTTLWYDLNSVRLTRNWIINLIFLRILLYKCLETREKKKLFYYFS